jgi:hypothetical protein
MLPPGFNRHREEKRSKREPTQFRELLMPFRDKEASPKNNELYMRTIDQLKGVVKKKNKINTYGRTK